jgi:hypothetical protein
MYVCMYVKCILKKIAKHLVISNYLITLQMLQEDITRL